MKIIDALIDDIVDAAQEMALRYDEGLPYEYHARNLEGRKFALKAAICKLEACIREKEKTDQNLIEVICWRDRRIAELEHIKQEHESELIAKTVDLEEARERIEELEHKLRGTPVEDDEFLFVEGEGEE